MCGIFLVYSKDGPVDLEKFNSSFQLLTHRGPNFSFNFKEWSGSLYAGQNILSIRESEYSKGSFYSTCGRFLILFNGELYNSFSNEVEYINTQLLKQDPVEVLKQLNGMFSVVIVDLKNYQIYFTVDKLSEKTLFWMNIGDCFIISSEIKPILNYQHSVKLNLNVLKMYFLTRHYMPGAETCFEGIYKLEADQISTFDRNFFKTTIQSAERFKSLVSQDLYRSYKKSKLITNEIVSALELEMVRLNETIRPNFLIGASLSGGTDSTVVSYFINKYFENNRTIFFSLSFDKKDSVVFASKKMAKKLSLNHVFVNVSKDAFKEEMLSLIDHFSSPLPTHSAVSQRILAKLAKDYNVKVFLGGEGGDECFAGYFLQQEMLKCKIKTDFYNPSSYSGLDFQLAHKLFEDDSFIDLNFNKKWEEALSCYDFIDDLNERVNRAALYLDIKQQLSEVGLLVADHSFMSCSIEARAILASEHILKVALNLPTTFLNQLNKKNLRDCVPIGLRKLIPTQKQGFSGYPNECAIELLNKQNYEMVKSVVFKDRSLPMDLDRATEWKLLNMELFLRNFGQYV